MTLDLISHSNALSTLVSNWLIHMNWAVSICRLSQYYTKRASREPPYLQRGIKQCAWVVCSPLSRCYVPGVQIVSAGEKLTKTKKRGKTRGGKGLFFFAPPPPPPPPPPPVFPVYSLTRPPPRSTTWTPGTGYPVACLVCWAGSASIISWAISSSRGNWDPGISILESLVACENGCFRRLDP